MGYCPLPFTCRTEILNRLVQRLIERGEELIKAGVAVVLTPAITELSSSIRYFRRHVSSIYKASSRPCKVAAADAMSCTLRCCDIVSPAPALRPSNVNPKYVTWRMGQVLACPEVRLGRGDRLVA